MSAHLANAARDAVSWARDYARSMAEQVRGGGRGTSHAFFAEKADGLDLALASHAAPEAISLAAADVLAERERQKTVEGWTPEHDDQHKRGQMAEAAACYAWSTRGMGTAVPATWPWGWKWWKPSTKRRNLVKAGALILAEIERLDRAAERQRLRAETGEAR